MRFYYSISLQTQAAHRLQCSSNFSIPIFLVRLVLSFEICLSLGDFKIHTFVTRERKGILGVRSGEYKYCESSSNSKSCRFIIANASLSMCISYNRVLEIFHLLINALIFNSAYFVNVYTNYPIISHPLFNELVAFQGHPSTKYPLVIQAIAPNKRTTAYYLVVYSNFGEMD